MNPRSGLHLKWWIGFGFVMIIVLLGAVYFRMNPTIGTEEQLAAGTMEKLITDYLENDEVEAQKLNREDKLGKVFAAYEVLGKEQAGEVQTLYLWTLQADVWLQDNQPRTINWKAGPMVVKLAGRGSQWEVVSSSRPSGENYDADLQALFPPELYALVKVCPPEEILGKVEEGVKSKARGYYGTTNSQLFGVKTNPPLPPDLAATGVVSAQGDKLAIIYPDDWETVGDIYLATMESGMPVAGDPLLLAADWRRLSLNQWVYQELFDLPPGHLMDVDTPKKVIWYNEEEILVIVGYAYGTVSPGGEVVRVNIDTGESEIIYAPEGNRQQVTDLELKGGKLLLTITTFEDNMLNPHDSLLEINL